MSEKKPIDDAWGVDTVTIYETPTDHRSLYPRIAADNQSGSRYVHVVWNVKCIATGNDNGTLMYMNKTTTGSTWSDVEEIVNYTGTDFDQDMVDIVADESNVYVVWEDIVQGSKDIF